jgi:hypothetical protein
MSIYRSHTIGDSAVFCARNQSVIRVSDETISLTPKACISCLDYDIF